MKAENGGVGYVKPGDHVDVFGYFEKGNRIPETKSMVILENVVVKAIDGNAVRDNGEQSTKSAKTIQLLIRESQYESAVTADNLGKLRVALRAPDEDGTEAADLENGATSCPGFAMQIKLAIHCSVVLQKVRKILSQRYQRPHPTNRKWWSFHLPDYPVIDGEVRVTYPS